MKNLHITHPEDYTFDGKLAVQNVIGIMRSVMDDFNREDNVVSVKYDGAPAIVFGTDKTNGRFFVGTKSVFNKGIKKICYTNDCIDYYYSGKDNLRNILKLCLKYLPRVAGVYQADYIGECNTAGNNIGCQVFTPNTITYKFDKAPIENIILAVHTQYVGDNFDDMIAVPQSSLTLPGLNVKWVDATVDYNEERIIEEAFKYSISAVIDQLEIMNDDDFPVFKTKTAKTQLMKLINTYIREGRILNAEDLSKETGINFRVFELYELIAAAKEILINRFLPCESVECFVNNRPANHEGIVIHHCEITSHDVIKLVRRYEFSRANFSNQKFQKTPVGVS